VNRIRRMEVTIETDEITIIRGIREIGSEVCRECGTDSMMSPDDAAALLGINVRSIDRWLEAGLIYGAANPAELQSVCANCILTFSRSNHQKRLISMDSG